MTPELLKQLEEAVHFSKFRAFARNTHWDEADVLEVVTTVLLEHVIDEEELLPARVNVEDVRFTEHNHGGSSVQPESERRTGHDRRQEGRAGVG